MARHGGTEEVAVWRCGGMRWHETARDGTVAGRLMSSKSADTLGSSFALAQTRQDVIIGRLRGIAPRAVGWAGRLTIRVCCMEAAMMPKLNLVDGVLAMGRRYQEVGRFRDALAVLTRLSHFRFL